jgi:hypothetical protein
MICLPTAITVACLIEPGFTYVLPRLLDQIPLTPPFIDWFLLFVAAVATLIVLAANWIAQAVFHNDSVSRSDKSSSRSQR